MTEQISEPQTIYLALSDEGSRTVIVTILESLGHRVPVAVDSGHQLIRASTQAPPDLLIASPNLCDMNGIDALIRVSSHRPTPAIVIARSDDLDQVEHALEDHVMAYLVEPITAQSMQPAIYLCRRRFEHFRKLESKVEKLEQKLEHRKTIERAKGIVMTLRGFNEQQAHDFLQVLARKSRSKLHQVAQSIIDANKIGIATEK